MKSTKGDIEQLEPYTSIKPMRHIFLYADEKPKKKNRHEYTEDCNNFHDRNNLSDAHPYSSQIFFPNKYTAGI